MPRRKSIRKTHRTPHLDPKDTRKTIKMLEAQGLFVPAFALKKTLREQAKRKKYRK